MFCLQRLEQALMLVKTDPYYSLTLVLCVTCQLACITVMSQKLTMSPSPDIPLLNKTVFSFKGPYSLGLYKASVDTNKYNCC